MTHTEIKATPRQEATFRCPCPRAAAITLLQWSRRGLDPLFYRNLFQRQQPESFGDRVELKDGDLTLILKNVTNKQVSDCVQEQKQHREIVQCFIKLTVRPRVSLDHPTTAVTAKYTENAKNPLDFLMLNIPVL